MGRYNYIGSYSYLSMAYNIKDVFYLSTSATIAAGTPNGGSAQLDLSAYIDPIARGRSKGTGLAVYKVHVSVNKSGSGGPIDDAEAGTFNYGLLAGADSGTFYGPKSMIANASTPTNSYHTALTPAPEVPYVVVRDNVCLVYQVGDNMTGATILSVRLECAQITLDQATLNQLLRTQTV